jgi:hypothetical protein
MAFRRLVVPSLLAVALLSGCDILEKIPLTPKEAVRAMGKFGLATRERVEESPDGTIFRLTVESRRPATWLEADRAMWTDLRTSCPEGQLHEDVATQPEDTRIARSGMKQYPAGTLFVRTVRCAPRLPFEFDIAADVSDDDAHDAMYQKLAGDGADGTRQLMLSWLYVDAFRPRYQQMQDTLGLLVHMRMADCPNGVAIRNLTLGVKAPAPGKAGDPRLDALFGFTTECVAAPAASAAAPAPGG